MKKDFRIRKRKDFVELTKFGLCFRTSSLVVQCRPNGLETYRVGFTASKRVGNAVVRNRCKRRMRAVANVVLDKMGLPGADYAIIARKSAFNADWNALLEEAMSATRFLNKKVFKCKDF